MKTKQRLRKAAALLLAVIQVIALSAIPGTGAVGGVTLSSPAVLYGGELVSDDMIIPDDAVLTARFSAKSAELLSGPAFLLLPLYLKPVENSGGLIVNAIDKNGVSRLTGTLTIDSGLTISFTQPPDDSNPGPEPGPGPGIDPGTDSGSEPQDAENNGASDDDTVTIPEADAPAADFPSDDEVLTFDIPCVYDFSVITPMGLITGTTFEQIIDSDYTRTVSIKGTGSSDIANGASIVVADTTVFQMRYDFSISDDKFSSLQALVLAAQSSGEYPEYVVAGLPAEMKWVNNGYPAQFYIDLGGTLYKFGEIIKEGEDIHIKFCGNFWTQPNLTEMVGYLTAFCEIKDYSNIADSGTAIVFSDSYSFTVNKTPKTPTQNAISKNTGTYNAEDNTILWTITFTPGDDTDPAKIIDTVAAGHEFDTAYPLTYHAGTTGTYSALPTGNYSLTSSQITINLAKTNPGDGSAFVYTVGQAYQFQYKTKLTSDAFDDLWDSTATSISVSNTAKVVDSSNNQLKTTTNSHTVNRSDTITISKSGTENSTTGNLREFTWTLTVTIKGASHIRNLVIHDDIPAGLSASTSFDVQNSSGNTITGVVTSSLTGGAHSDGMHSCDIDFAFGDGTFTDTTYTITYKTTIPDSYFDNATDSNTFTNYAWLTYTYAPGTGTTYDIASATVNKGLYNHSKLISKSHSGTGYNTANHTITWTITVNPYKVNVTKKDDGTTLGTIVDTLPSGLALKKDAAGQYVSGVSYSISGTNSSAIGFVGYDEINRKISFNIGALGANTATITIMAEVIDPLVWAYNVATCPTYTNRADISAYVNSSDTPTTDYATNNVTPTSHVLTKTHLAYDHEKNTIVWRVTVNDNKMPMPDAVLNDTLANHLSYVGGTAKIVSINGIALTEAQEALYALTDGTDVIWDPLTSQNLEIDLGGKADNHTIVVEFKTQVDVNNYPGYKDDRDNNNMINISNAIELERDDYGPVTTTNTVSIENHVLSKGGIAKADVPIPGGSGRTAWAIDYAVNINPHGLDLSSLTLEDELPKGVILDISTVKLYYATVNSSTGVLTKSNIVGKTEVHHDDWEWEWKYDPDPTDGTTVMHVTLPNEVDGRYILEYRCLVLEEHNEYTNTISIDGSDITSTGNRTLYKDDFYSAYGGGKGFQKYPDPATVTITKLDGMRPDWLLENIEFELWTVVPDGAGYALDMLVDAHKTDADGKLTFGPFISTGRYCLIEIIDPDTGYENASVTNVIVNSTDISLGEGTPLPIWVQEIGGKKGDAVPSDIYTFTPVAGGVRELIIVNDPNTADVTFIKQSPSGKGLAGAKFKLTTDIKTTSFTNDAVAGIYHMTVTSGSDGTVKFADVPHGTYTLEEIAAPSGYSLDKTKYKVEVGPDTGGFLITKSVGGAEMSKRADNTYFLMNTAIASHNSDFGGFTIKTSDNPDNTDNPSEATDSQDAADDPDDPNNPNNTDDLNSRNDPDDQENQNGTSSFGTADYAQYDTTGPRTPINELPGGISPHSMDNYFIMQDDGSFLEIDPEGVPLGLWHYDEDEEVWIFDDIVPLGDFYLPQTGDGVPTSLLFAVLGAALIFSGVMLRRKTVKTKQMR